MYLFRVVKLVREKLGEVINNLAKFKNLYVVSVVDPIKKSALPQYKARLML